MPDEGAHLLELDEELDVALVDLEVLVVELVGKGLALGVLDLLHLHVAAVIELELGLPLLPDLGQLPDVILVGPALAHPYVFWL